MIRSPFRFCDAMFAASFLVTVASARSQMTAPVTSEGEFFVHNFKFHSGESTCDHGSMSAASIWEAAC